MPSKRLPRASSTPSNLFHLLSARRTSSLTSEDSLECIFLAHMEMRREKEEAFLPPSISFCKGGDEKKVVPLLSGGNFPRRIHLGDVRSLPWHPPPPSPKPLPAPTAITCVRECGRQQRAAEKREREGSPAGVQAQPASSQALTVDDRGETSSPRNAARLAPRPGRVCIPAGVAAEVLPRSHVHFLRRKDSRGGTP